MYDNTIDCTQKICPVTSYEPRHEKTGFLHMQKTDADQRLCFHYTDSTIPLLTKGYRYHKLRKAFSKFYRRHYKLISKFNVGLKSLLHQRLSEPEFYGDLVYKFKKIRDMN